MQLLLLATKRSLDSLIIRVLHPPTKVQLSLITPIVVHHNITLCIVSAETGNHLNESYAMKCFHGLNCPTDRTVAKKFTPNKVWMLVAIE